MKNMMKMALAISMLVIASQSVMARVNPKAKPEPNASLSCPMRSGTGLFSKTKYEEPRIAAKSKDGKNGNVVN